MTYDPAKICPHCHVRDDDHDYEHMARECYPKQIATLRRQLEEADAAVAALRDMVAMGDGSEIAGAVAATERHKARSASSSPRGTPT
jgi:hypothetical protein